jgi:dTDP-4-dehydrorhamnose reductase
MKIIVTGAGGLLGQDIWRLFEKEHTLIAIGRNQPFYIPPAQWRSVDLTQEDVVYNVITHENPDLVIHTAAYNDVDGAEKNPEMAYLHNSYACRNLAIACQRFDTILMSVSTDYVFDGQSVLHTGYREFDPCRPISRYGESKYWGERYISDLLNKFFIIRTSWLFGPGRETWIDKVAASIHTKREVVAVSDMVSAPTYTPDLAEALFQLAQTRRYSTYHLTNTGFCSRVDLAQEVARLAAKGQKAQIKSVTQAELNLPAPRPAHSGLDNLAWRLDGNKPLRSWQEALETYFEKASVMK